MNDSLPIKILLQVVALAQEEHEKSYNSSKRDYDKSFDWAIESAFKQRLANCTKDTPTPVERELALFLMRNAWNEVQEWVRTA